MNRRTTVPVFLGCAFALLAQSPAFADFTGLEVINRTDISACGDVSDPDIPFKLRICEVLAVYDDSADRLISLGFSNVSTTDPAGFFQHSLGSNTAPQCNLIPLYPALECDSFVTLGLDCDTGGSTLDPDFDSTAFNTSGSVSGGWYNSAPPNGQGAPDANGRILIARLSYKQNKTANGDVCVFMQTTNSTEIVAFPLQPFDCSVPGMQAGGGGTICYVDDDGDSAKTCLNGWTDACPDLQAALALASMGSCSEIWVAEGTYLPSDCTPACTKTDRDDTFQLINGTAVYGGFPNGGGDGTFGARNPEMFISELSGDLAGDDNPVMDFPNGPSFSDNSYHVVTGNGITDTDNTILDGFTITGGNANVPGPDPLRRDGGAGMMNFMGSPTVSNCTFSGNSAMGHSGGGMLNDGTLNEPTNPRVINCTFAGNFGNFAGGGINSRHSNPTMTNCKFIGNSASFGGGLSDHAGVISTVTNCTFIGNTAVSGGGMRSTGSTLTNCVFMQNSAERFGGAILQVSDSTTVTNCLFSGNTAEDGGAISHHSGTLAVTNCTFSNNTADDGGDPTRGLGGAIKVGNPGEIATATVDNCIMWGNTATMGGNEIYVDTDATLTIDFSDIEGGEAAVGGPGTLNWGLGNIGEDPVNHDPLFANAGGGDLHLLPGSPCIDAADNNAIGPCNLDLDGNERFFDDPATQEDPGLPSPEHPDDIVDMGAYEFGGDPELDCDGNGLADSCCPADFNFDGIVNAFDLAQLLGDWGPCPDPCMPGTPDCTCQADFDNDCSVEAFDLASLLGSWGPCVP